MESKNIDTGKIWAKSDHWLKVMAIFATPFKDNLGFVKVRLFGEPYAPGFIFRRIHGTELMKTPCIIGWLP